MQHTQLATVVVKTSLSGFDITAAGGSSGVNMISNYLKYSTIYSHNAVYSVCQLYVCASMAYQYTTMVVLQPQGDVKSRNSDRCFYYYHRKGLITNIVFPTFAINRFAKINLLVFYNTVAMGSTSTIITFAIWPDWPKM